MLLWRVTGSGLMELLGHSQTGQQESQMVGIMRIVLRRIVVIYVMGAYSGMIPLAQENKNLFAK